MKILKYSGNPILKPDSKNAWENLCVLNPGVIFDKKSNKFIMLYRAAGNEWEHYIRLGLATSEDGYHFTKDSDKPIMDVIPEDADGGCIEDPRIIKMDGVYYITYAGRPFFPGKYWVDEDYKKVKAEREIQPESAPRLLHNETTSYLACTRDFKNFKRLGRITDSRYDDRDVIIFPEKVNGKFVKLSRPKRDDESPAVWITFSNDLLEWGEPVKLFSGTEEWEGERIGSGCPPLKTKYGWILLYHGVSVKDGFYRVGFVLLDINDPTKILARTKKFVMEPEEDYEIDGLWTGCVFPTAMIEKDGLLFIYYGCADKYISVATVPLEDLVDYMKSLMK